MLQVTLDKVALARIQNRLGSIRAVAEKTFDEYARKFKQEVQRLTPVGRGSGSRAKYSWHGPYKKTRPGGWSYRLKNRKPYAVQLEKGSRPGKAPWPRPGRRTTRSTSPYGDGTRIYSTQAPRGMFYPAKDKLDPNKILAEVAQTIEKSWK